MAGDLQPPALHLWLRFSGDACRRCSSLSVDHEPVSRIPTSKYGMTVRANLRFALHSIVTVRGNSKNCACLLIDLFATLF